MVSPESLEIVRRGKEIYEQRLKAHMEADYRDHFLAIEPDFGDYFLRPTLHEAADAARSAHPDKTSYVMRIGHAGVVQFGYLELVRHST